MQRMRYVRLTAPAPWCVVLALGLSMIFMRCVDGQQQDGRLESQLWLLSGLVQSSREAQMAAVKCLPDLVHLLDTGTECQTSLPVLCSSLPKASPWQERRSFV